MASYLAHVEIVTDETKTSPEFVVSKFAGWVADTDCTDCATGVRSVVGRVNVAVIAPRDEPSGSQASEFRGGSKRGERSARHAEVATLARAWVFIEGTHALGERGYRERQGSPCCGTRGGTCGGVVRCRNVVEWRVGRR